MVVSVLILVALLMWSCAGMLRVFRLPDDQNLTIWEVLRGGPLVWFLTAIVWLSKIGD